MGERRRTEETQKRYDRIAPVYDAMEVLVEWLAFKEWRERLWSLVQGKRVLEVGVGTGKNLPYHPEDTRVTAIDLSHRMLVRAQRRAREQGRDADVAQADLDLAQADLDLVQADLDLVQADAQRLPFARDAFDVAVATFVFCSVPDAVVGLEEVRRVVKPGGDVLLLEHVRIDRPLIGPFMDFLDPVVVRIMGPHIARQTVENVTRSGLSVEDVHDLAPGALVKLIHARVV